MNHDNLSDLAEQAFAERDARLHEALLNPREPAPRNTITGRATEALRNYKTHNNNPNSAAAQAIRDYYNPNTEENNR